MMMGEKKQQQQKGDGENVEGNEGRARHSLNMKWHRSLSTQEVVVVMVMMMMRGSEDLGGGVTLDVRLATEMCSLVENVGMCVSVCLCVVISSALWATNSN